jgi:hypothetical protein
MAQTMPNPRPPEEGLSGTPNVSGRTAEAVWAEIDALRRREGTDLKPFEIWRRVADLVWQYLGRGKFYCQGARTYYQPAEAETILAVCRDDTSFCVLLDDLGLNPAEDIFSFVLEHLRLQTHRARAPAPPGGLSHPGAEQPDMASGCADPAESPENDPRLIRLRAAAEFYGVSASYLSKAAAKSPGQPGYLWSVKWRGARYFRKGDLLNVTRSRAQIRR